MSALTSRLAELNPFGKANRKDDEEDQGEPIAGSASIAGGGHAGRQTNITKNQLRVSRALRAFLIKENILSERDVGEDPDHLTPALHALVEKPHIEVPAALTDRSHPLPEYFISSTHNTYLMAHQLFGESSADAYSTVLRAGARCVEIDAWDNDDDPEEPKVTHGYTLVSNIPFRAVCQAIGDSVDREASEARDEQSYRAAPILVSLENHCGEHGQLRLAQIMKEIWGDRLLSKAVRDEGTEEQAGGQHVRLAELGSKIVVIVEHHLSKSLPNNKSSKVFPEYGRCIYYVILLHLKIRVTICLHVADITFQVQPRPSTKTMTIQKTKRKKRSARELLTMRKRKPQLPASSSPSSPI